MSKGSGVPSAAIISLSIVLVLSIPLGGCRKGNGSREAEQTQRHGSRAITPAASASLAGEEGASERTLHPPTPDIALEINRSTELTVLQGTPLIVTVRLANQRAINVLSLNAAENKPPTELHVPAVQLPPAWRKFIRFEVRAGSEARTSTWLLAAISEHGTQPVTLDGRENPEATWVLAPDAAAAVAPGVYHIVAVLDVSGRGDRGWEGHVESEPVRVTIEARPPALQGAAAVKSDLDFARYWAEAGNWDRSLAAARSATARDPKSIEATMLIGDALAAENDPGGALSAYETALGLFREKYEGKAYEQPQYLLYRIAQIMRENPPKDLAPQGTKVPPPRTSRP